MTFRNLTNIEETILKRSFNNWGIFEIFETLRILIRTVVFDAAIGDQNINISKQDIVPNKILYLNPSNNRSVNKVEKYNYDNHGRIQSQTSTRGYSNGIECARSEKYSKRTEVFVHSNVKYDDVLFKKLNPIIVGLKIGTIKNKKFAPNLNFAEFVVKHNKNMDYPHVIINTKAENLVVFGRDIMGSSILSFFKDIKENQQVIILNHNKEVIGFGKSRYSGSLIVQPNIISIDTTQDIGTYYLKNENRLAKDIDKKVEHSL
jgi:60S ribosome subunit biogenesis protein NIP7